MHVLYLDAKGGCVRGFDTKKEFVLFFPADRRRWIGRLIKEELDELSRDTELVGKRYDRFRSIGMDVIR